jgi:hypothetical protein
LCILKCGVEDAEAVWDLVANAEGEGGTSEDGGGSKDFFEERERRFGDFLLLFFRNLRSKC